MPALDPTILEPCLQADKLLAMDDTQQVLKHLGQLLSGRHNRPHELEQQQSQHQQQQQEQHQAGVGQQQQQQQAASPISVVLGAYQVLLVSASLKATSLNAAPAWLCSNPVMVTATPTAAQLRSAAGRLLASYTAHLSHTTAAGSAAAQPPAEAAVGGECDQEAGVLNNGQQHHLQHGQALKTLETGELPRSAHKALMLPSHVTHHVITYNANKRSSMQKCLVRLLAVCKAEQQKVLVFVGQQQSVGWLFDELKRLDAGEQVVRAEV